MKIENTVLLTILIVIGVQVVTSLNANVDLEKEWNLGKNTVRSDVMITVTV